MSQNINNKIPKLLPNRLIKLSITFFTVGIFLLFMSYASNSKLLMSLGTIIANASIALFGISILTKLILYIFNKKNNNSKNDN